MKTLADRITVTVATNANALTGIYPYRVKDDYDGRVIFIGNFFHQQGESNYTFDITDIVRSDLVTTAYNDIYDGANYNFDRLITEYDVEVTINNVTTSMYSDRVYKVYPYPNFNEVTNVENVYFEYDEDVRNIKLSVQQPKTNITGNWYDYTPIIPCYSNSADYTTSTFPLFWQAICGEDVDEICTFGQVYSGSRYDDIFEEYTYTGGRHSAGMTTTIRGISRDVQMEGITEVEIYVAPTDFVSADEGEILAVGNECLNKRYFLVWQDRLGSMMSKPFNDFTEYSESFDKDEIQDYTNTRKLNNVQVQPKWKINSGWINEKVYPLYESIYVSPVLFLYDMKYNKTYNVMVKGDYVEKTFKNQKKLININLELEETNKQNILY